MLNKDNLHTIFNQLHKSFQLGNLVDFKVSLIDIKPSLPQISNAHPDVEHQSL